MTFSSTKGTPYYRLQHRRANFDTVVALRVEGVSISAIARVEGIAWNTVARWLERAALSCRRFNSRRITGFAVEELQADEIRSFAGGKDRITWVFAAIEVWSQNSSVRGSVSRLFMLTDDAKGCEKSSTRWKTARRHTACSGKSTTTIGHFQSMDAWKTLSEFMARRLDVSVDDIARVAHRYFVASNRVIATTRSDPQKWSSP